MNSSSKGPSFVLSSFQMDLFPLFFEEDDGESEEVVFLRDVQNSVVAFYDVLNAFHSVSMQGFVVVCRDRQALGEADLVFQIVLEYEDDVAVCFV